MRLYLIQHGEAFSKEENPERPLTEKGKKDVAKTAEFLKQSDIKIDIIYHSAKRRAKETAIIVAEKLLPKEGAKEKEGLTPNDPVDKIFDELSSESRDLMIAGHLPFLQKLTSLALTGSESQEIVSFQQGGAVSLERTEEGSWRLIFAIIPDLLK